MPPITQLHPGVTSGRRYGSFHKTAAPHPVNRITQLRPGAISGRRYGSFAGRSGTVTAAATLPPFPVFIADEGQPNAEPTKREADRRLDSLYAAGIWSEEVLGRPELRIRLAAQGINSAEAFGQQSLMTKLEPAGVASGEAFDPAALAVRLEAEGVLTGEDFNEDDS